jgi:hypothetical protein
MKFVYLIDQPFNKRIRQRFGIDYFLQQGDSVEVIDMTQLIYKEVHHEFLERGGKYESVGIIYHRPVSLLELMVVLMNRRSRNAILIDFMGDPFIGQLIKAYFKFTGLRHLKYISGLIPSINSKSLILRIHQQIINQGVFVIPNLLSNMLSRVFNKIFSKILFHLFPCDIWVLSCLTAIQRIPVRDRNKGIIIHAHAFDYDLYLKSRSEDLTMTLDDHEYAVFLDEDMCFHTDFLYTNTNPPTSPEKYFPALNTFFRMLKNKVGINIVVAEHPRAAYTTVQKVEYFQGCKVYSNVTAQLIKNATLVLCHASTSIGFAVLYKKPILFLTSDEILKSSVGQNTDLFANILGGTLINIDKKLNEIDILVNCSDPSAENYNNYIDEYIKFPKTPIDIYSWHHVRNILSN